MNELFGKYFIVTNDNTYCIADSFNTDVTEITSLTAQENQLINIVYDSYLKDNFKEFSLFFFGLV